MLKKKTSKNRILIYAMIEWQKCGILDYLYIEYMMECYTD